jgi:hypothetical protein
MIMIDIDISHLPIPIGRYMEKQIRICEDTCIPITLTKDRMVTYKDLHCAGYFDDDPLGFAVACGGSYRNWFPTFVHETCHMQQWLDQSPIWTRRVDGKPPSDLFDVWVTGQQELLPDTLSAVIDALVDVELDCERRSVERISSFELPVTLNSYIRKSNAYIWSYRYMEISRNWDHSSFYQHPQVWRRMPSHFNNDYAQLPASIKAIFDQAVQELHIHR